jgi:hypothetical protein
MAVATHECQPWMLDIRPSGRWYCRGCGESKRAPGAIETPQLPEPVKDRAYWEESLQRNLGTGRRIPHPGQGRIRCPGCGCGQEGHDDDCEFRNGELVVSRHPLLLQPPAINT